MLANSLRFPEANSTNSCFDAAIEEVIDSDIRVGSGQDALSPVEGAGPYPKDPYSRSSLPGSRRALHGE